MRAGASLGRSGQVVACAIMPRAATRGPAVRWFRVARSRSINLLLGPVDMVRRFISAVGLLLVACLLGACASGPALPPAPAKVAQSDYSYVIGAGDSLNIIVWRNPELSMAVPVRPDGKIAAPLVDELVAQGKTSTELAREVEKVLGKYVRDPIVTVLVTGFVGPFSEQVRIVGEAARPQALPYRNKMTLLDVMIAAGGLTDFAAGNRAILLRSAEQNKQYGLRIKDLLKGGDVSANVEMRPGDIVIIPQSLF
jgi:polysaccharide biosynthesis/export protein